MLKLIALYVSLDGDMNNLCDYLISKSFILEKLAKNLVINKIIILRNESNMNLNKSFKENVKSNKELNFNDNNTDKAINVSRKYLDNLINIRDFFNTQYHNISLEKVITRQSLNLEHISCNYISNLNGKNFYNLYKSILL